MSAIHDEPDPVARIERRLEAIEKYLAVIARECSQMAAHTKRLDDWTVDGTPAPQATE